MHHPFQQTELIKAERFCTLPGQIRKKGRNEWTAANRGGIEVECFLEGPCFDREGNLWVVDIPFGRIFRLPGLFADVPTWREQAPRSSFPTGAVSSGRRT